MPLAQRENCTVPNKKLFGPMVLHMSLSKTLMYMYMYMYIHVYVHVHTCIHVHVHTCTYTCTYITMSANVGVYVKFENEITCSIE